MMEEKNFIFNGLRRIDGINPHSIKFSEKETNVVVGSYSFENINFIFIELKSNEYKNFSIYSNHLDFTINLNKKINKDDRKTINKIIEQARSIAGIDIEFKFPSESVVEFSIKGYVMYKESINNPESLIHPIIETSLAAYMMIMNNFIERQ